MGNRELSMVERLWGGFWSDSGGTGFRGFSGQLSEVSLVSSPALIEENKYPVR